MQVKDAPLKQSKELLLRLSIGRSRFRRCLGGRSRSLLLVLVVGGRWLGLLIRRLHVLLIDGSHLLGSGLAFSRSTDITGVPRSSHSLHVGSLVERSGGVNREEVLRPRLLPCLEGPALKLRDAHLTEVLPRALLPLFLLELLPLRLGHPVGDVLHRQASGDASRNRGHERDGRCEKRKEEERQEHGRPGRDVGDLQPWAMSEWIGSRRTSPLSGPLLLLQPATWLPVLSGLGNSSSVTANSREQQQAAAGQRAGERGREKGGKKQEAEVAMFLFTFCFTP